MITNRNKKVLSIEKFRIARLGNLQSIIGGEIVFDTKNYSPNDNNSIHSTKTAPTEVEF